MSRLSRSIAVAALLAVLALGAGCRAAGTPEPSPNEHSSTELIESPKEFDGSEIAFAGEVIGEAMKRGDMAWLHINDDAYYVKNVEEGAQLGGYNTGMAVWLPADLADRVTYFGDYKHEGDIVEVEGVYNAACGEHGGDTDIHATSLSVVETGHVVVDKTHPAKTAWAIGLALLAVGLCVADRFWLRGVRGHRA
ncbi:MAG: hypothetical protein EG823_02110 [Actinobacteria bacterium]|nr:hypothetical protein [Actinomycetota bacterium]